MRRTINMAVNWRSLLVHCLLFMLPMHIAWADRNPYYVNHAKGWHWYDDPKAKQTEPDQEQDSVSEMNALRAMIEQSLDKAILHPTKDNIKHYIELQNQVAGNAQDFSTKWKALLMETPQLDYSLKHPTNNMAKQVEQDQSKMAEDQAIRQLAKTGGLFFFYRSSCPYCIRFAPIVRDFVDTYQIPIVAITTDGKALPEFPDSVVDQGQSAKFHLEVEPALFAVNPYNHQAYPVAYGLTSLVEIKRRILDISTRYQRLLK